MVQPHTATRAGFTLIELLVVITIIGILMSLLLPAVQQVRAAARRLQCSNNIKQQVLALHNYHNTFEVFPKATGGTDRWSWSTGILPYLEQTALYDSINFQYGYNRVENHTAVRTQVPTFHCPSAPPAELISCCASVPGVQDAGESNYSATSTHEPVYYASTTTGSGVMYDASRTSMASIRDGTSQTFIIAESDHADDDPWKDRSGVYCPNRACAVGKMWSGENRVTTAYGINSESVLLDAGTHSYHEGGSNFGFADGHVQFVSESINQFTLVALTTRAGREVLDGSDY